MAAPIVGKVDFKTTDGATILTVDPDSSFIQVRIVTKSGTVKVMEITNTGSLSLYDEGARLDGMIASLIMGANGKNAMAYFRDGFKKDVVTINAGTGDVVVGGNGKSGDLFLNDANNKTTLHLRSTDALVRVGGNGVDGEVRLVDKSNNKKISILASSGDIVLENADCAEDFDTAGSLPVEPGSTLVLDSEGRVRESQEEYDRRVVGVVSGAGALRPAIVLDRKPSSEPRAPVAMVGKVFCKVDATFSAIEAGDLLTTSSRPGHAMKASDPARSFGAVLGKALGRCEGGQALIPVLVALQ